MKVCFKYDAIKTLLLICSLSILATANARVTLPSVITDNMVLQQKTDAALWGTTGAGVKVTITTGWNDKQYSVTAGPDGQWKVKVQTPSFGGPYLISINDGDETRLNNVLIGEVWVCSGQSNMEMPLAGWGKINNYEQEIAQANYPNIRLLQLEHVTSNAPLDNAKVTNGGWAPCTPQTVAEFSSVAYFFARKIFNETKIPIGLIHTSWGGTIAEAWMSSAALKTTDDFRAAVDAIEKAGVGESQKDYEKKLQDWQNSFTTKDAGYSNGQFSWPSASGNDWKTMRVPALWEETVLPNFDGVVWFKKKVFVPESMAAKELNAALGLIDDNDITWWNGEKIGETIGYNKERKYSIPANMVKAGENEITVRVFDGSGGGGLYGDANKLQLSNAEGEKIALAGNWNYKVGVDKKDIGEGPALSTGPNRPTVLFNAMIHPLLNYAIRGAIWYQGESNAGRAYQYRWLFAGLIKDWRNNWGQGDFPFYFVQLANFMKPSAQPEESAWAELREAQLKTLALPNTGMAVITDIGEAADIHPKNKQDVGGRLALIALAKTYSKNVAYSGPMYLSKSLKGNTLILNFTQLNGGLKANSTNGLAGFEISGSDKKFHVAEAFLKGNQVVVSSKEVTRPVAVRYNWANNPNGNLYNQAALPASPFRTDEWQGITFGKK